MASSRVLCLVLVVGLLGEAFTVPAPLDVLRSKRGYADNQLDSNEDGGNKDLEQAASDNRPAREDGSSVSVTDNTESESRVETTTSKPELAVPVDDDSDEDDDFEPMNTAPTAGGGSNIFSLLRLANAIFPSSSSGANIFLRRLLRRYFNNQLTANIPIFPPNAPLGPNYSPFVPTTAFLRRQDVAENKINIDEIEGLKPPTFQRQETEEDNDDETSEESDEDNAAESVEDDNNNGGNGNGDNGNASKQKSESNEKENEENDSDYSDEPPEGDGQGGGILGILAGLSGGEDGQSDLGSLLATISGIVANLSGDGFDLNALIGSGIGLFVGLLSEGEENPGAVIASYLLTSLDTITGGGSKNNGAFFGTFLSKLIRGTSAGGDPDASSEEGKEPEKDSAGFLASFLMGLLGDMSKGSSGGSSCSHCPNHPNAEQRLTGSEEAQNLDEATN